MGNFNLSEEQEQRERNSDLDEAIRFQDCINKMVTVTGAQFLKTGDIQWVIMDTSDGKISTSGKVVVEQLQAIQKKLEAGDTTKVRLVLKKGKYHYLEDA